MSSETVKKFTEVRVNFNEEQFQIAQPESELARTRFDAFHIHTTTYVTVGPDDHEIQVSILIPKEIGQEPCPLHVKFHGGGFVSCYSDAGYTGQL